MLLLMAIVVILLSPRIVINGYIYSLRVFYQKIKRNWDEIMFITLLLVIFLIFLLVIYGIYWFFFLPEIRHLDQMRQFFTVDANPVEVQMQRAKEIIGSKTASQKEIKIIYTWLTEVDNAHLEKMRVMFSLKYNYPIFLKQQIQEAILLLGDCSHMPEKWPRVKEAQIVYEWMEELVRKNPSKSFPPNSQYALYVREFYKHYIVWQNRRATFLLCQCEVMFIDPNGTTLYQTTGPFEFF